MSFIETIYEKAKKSNGRIALPECENEIMMRAAASAAESGFAQPVVVGDEAKMRELCRERGISEELFSFADVNDLSYREDLAKRYSQLQGGMLGEKAIMRRTEDSLFMALVMEKVGDASCTISGLDATTAEVILAAQMIIGLDENSLTPSSVGLFELKEDVGLSRTLFGYGDSAICVDPDAEELAGIAISSCDTFKSLVGYAPHCAMLCYSTCGSGEGDSVDKVVEAVEIAQQKRPDLLIDGEFQLDAAINQAIGKKKVTRDSEVAGCADLLIWPDLNAGNIGLKLVQQFAHPDCYGPFLQGFALPIIDVSRGETEQGIRDTIAIASVWAADYD